MWKNRNRKAYLYFYHRLLGDILENLLICMTIKFKDVKNEFIFILLLMICRKVPEELEFYHMFRRFGLVGC
jgi:hypothetical protein